jgi:GT2 family glycosyltransferase
LNRGLPLIATDVGGISELIADSSKPHVLTDPTSSALARAIRKTLADGPHRPLPSHSQAQARADLVEVHQEILARKRARSRLPQPLLAPGLKVFNSPAVHINTESHGMISVCLVHRNRPGLLIQALHGYEAQSFKNFEVIIADNGSTDDNTAFILQLIRERSPFTYPVRILELGENRFPEGARNAAASVAVGRWLKFHDDDNVPKPHELQVFAASIATGKAHAISCGLDVFDSNDYPTDQTPISSKVLFMGDGGAASYIENYMGDANFAIGRETFEKVGGFDERGYLLFAEDWCFLAKLKGLGYVVASIPDCLVWYRMNPTQRALQWRKKDIAGARNRVRNALAGRVSHEVQELIALAQSANPNRGAPG